MSRKKRAVRPGTSGNSRPTPSAPMPVDLSESPPAGMLWLARGLLLVALGIAAYLSVVSLNGGGIAGCGADAGCSEVLGSRWSKWIGIPVSLPAALAYLVMIGMTFAELRSVNSRCVLQTLCLVIFGAAAWFVGLSVFAVGKVCPYCLMTHACGVVGSGLLLAWLTGRHPLLSAKGALDGAWERAIPAALAGLVALIGGQLLFAPKSFRVASMASNTNSTRLAAPGMSPPAAPAVAVTLSSTGGLALGASATSNSVQRSPAILPTVPPSQELSSAGPPPSHPTLRLHGSAFALDLTDVPVLGSAYAEKVMVSMFDYTCEHCRHAHTSIMTAQRYFSNRLAVVSLPTPLDSKCNPWIRRTAEQHENACALARLALAVWRSDRKRFPEYDEWVMTSADALRPERAHERALELVGLIALERALGDPWIDQTIRTSVSLYRTNWLVAKSSSMPMMVIGTNVISGSVRSPNEVFQLLDRGLGLKQTP
ncbi:MAG: vitamin K epoxide reductase family protein [Pedosphaera sp.]|nr:vitamin K epoxide reductase family protein [Pedosphaera sp.]